MIDSENCIKCSYKASPGSDKYIYTCLECVDGKCHKNSLPNNCLEYRYKIGTNDIECIKCENDYYLSDGNCNGNIII